MPENSSALKTRLRQGVMVLAGIAAGGVVVGVTGDLVFNSEMSYAAIVLVATAVVVAAAALWRTGNREWRAFVIGLVVIWVAFMVLLGVPWMTMDPDSGPGGSPSVPADRPGNLTET